MKNLTKKERKEVLLYLDDLRDSGVTNMFGASIYIQEEFGYGKTTSAKLLADWMNTYAERKGLQ